MPVHSEVREPQLAVVKPAYPYLGKLKGQDGISNLIVLFSSFNNGVVVQNNAKFSYTVGDSITTWAEGAFIPLPSGSVITLTQV